VPIEMTYDNYKACRAPKKLFVVPGASHGMSYVVDKDGYQEAVKVWLCRLRSQRQSRPEKACEQLGKMQRLSL